MRELVSSTLMRIAMLAGSITVACFATLGPLLSPSGLQPAVTRALRHPVVQQRLHDQLTESLTPVLGDKADKVAETALTDPALAALLVDTVGATFDGETLAGSAQRYTKIVKDAGARSGVDDKLIAGIEIGEPVKTTSKPGNMIASARSTLDHAGRIAVGVATSASVLALVISKRRSRKLRSLGRWAASSCLFPALALFVLPRILKGRNDLPSVLAGELVRSAAPTLTVALVALAGGAVLAFVAARFADSLERTGWANDDVLPDRAGVDRRDVWNSTKPRNRR